MGRQTTPVAGNGTSQNSQSRNHQQSSSKIEK